MNAPQNRQTIEGMSSPAMASQARRPAASPVFKPELMRSLRMHPVVAALVAVMVFLAVVGYALMQRPAYEAESIVQMEPTSSKLLGDSSAGLFDSTRYDTFLAQQMQTAQRLDVLSAAIRTLPQGTWQQPGESLPHAAGRLQAALKTTRVATSYQVSFTLKGADPVKIAATLNAVVQAYLAAGRNEQLSLADQRMQILGEEKQRVSNELDVDRNEQARLSASLGMASPGMDVGNPYDAQLVGLRTELASAREAHDIAAAQLASVSGAGSTQSLGLSATAEEMIGSDAGLSSMKSSINQRRATLSSQMAGLTPENPIYKQDQEEISDLDRSLETMSTQMRDKAARRLQDKLRADLARTGDVESRLNAQLAQQTYAATSASPRLQRATELTADISRLMKRYAEVDDALRSLQLENSGPGQLRQALEATPPTTPQASRRGLLLASALPLALFFGAGAAIFIRKRDQHIYTALDMENLLGFPPIAVLPASQDVSSPVLQEYTLRLAGGVESAFRTGGARTFVLTSVSAGQSLSLLGKSLLERLILLGIDVVMVPAAQVLDPGFRTGHSGEPAQIRQRALFKELASGQRQEGVAPSNLAYLKTLHDIVFIEAAPLLISAETEYMVRCSDATILVAESARTLQAELLQSALLLERLNVRGVAAVLDGLQLRYGNASFRRAIATLEREHVQRVESKAVAFDALRPATPLKEAVLASPAATAVRAEEAETEHVPSVPEADNKERKPTQVAQDIKPEAAAVAAVTDAPDVLVAAATPHKQRGPVLLPTSERPATPVSAEQEVPLRVEQAAVPAVPEPAKAHETKVQAPASRPWLQRIFRQPQATISVLPDNESDAPEQTSVTPLIPHTPFARADLETADRLEREIVSEPTAEVALTTEPASQPVALADLPEPVVGLAESLETPEPILGEESVETPVEADETPVQEVQEVSQRTSVAELPTDAAIPVLETNAVAETIIAETATSKPSHKDPEPARVREESLPALRPRYVAPVWPDFAAEVTERAPARIVAETPDPGQEERPRLESGAELELEPVSAERRLASRWDPIQPLRGEPMPWLVASGSHAAARVNKAQEQPLTPAAALLARRARARDVVRAAPINPPITAAPPATAPRAFTPARMTRSNAAAAEPLLTRDWGLLSRFTRGQSGNSQLREAGFEQKNSEAREEGIPAAHASRGYRRR